MDPRSLNWDKKSSEVIFSYDIFGWFPLKISFKRWHKLLLLLCWTANNLRNIYKTNIFIRSRNNHVLFDVHLPVMMSLFHQKIISKYFDLKILSYSEISRIFILFGKIFFLFSTSIWANGLVNVNWCWNSNVFGQNIFLLWCWIHNLIR